ncbi:MAG: YCF48-related protein [Candidatus Sulfotelmatobacter sp.]
MQNIPKVVQARLRRPTPVTAESHPDADLLTAFAEQSLAGPERDHLLEHLARCGDCREVVLLALPPEVELPPLAESSANWFRWTPLSGSAWRWTAVAAGVVLIASIGVLQYRRQQSRELATNVFQPKPAITTPAPNPPPSSQVAVPQTGIQKDKMAAPRAQTALENKPAPSGVADFRRPGTLGGVVGGPIARAGGGSGGGQSVNRGAFHGSASARPPASPALSADTKQNPAPTPAPQMVVVTGAAPTVEAQSQTAQITAQPPAPSQTQDQFVQNEPAEQPAASVDQSEVVGKAKPALAQAPRWTISASGALQRSLDGGQTWLDASVAADGSMLDRPAKTQMMTVEVQADLNSEAASATRSAPTANAKSVKKQAAPVSQMIFRALSVSSNGAEVWAGGSGGALFHTMDGGNRWTRVVPATAGIFLTGDITSIQFNDPRNGTVTTSNAEAWTTLDAGRTWRKQP